MTGEGLAKKAKTGNDIFYAIDQCLVNGVSSRKQQGESVLIQRDKMHLWESLALEKWVRVGDVKKQLQEIFEWIERNQFKKDTYGVYDPMEIASPTVFVNASQLKHFLEKVLVGCE